MPYSPPWTDINPRDFLNAAESGASIGLQARGLRDREINQFDDNQRADRELSDQEAARVAQQQLEGSRLNYAAQQARMNTGLNYADLALKAKDSAAMMEATQQEKQRQDQIAALKDAQPKIISQRDGSVISIDPLTGSVTPLKQGTPANAPNPPFTTADRQIVNLREYINKAKSDYALTKDPETKAAIASELIELNRTLDSLQNPTAAAPPVSPLAAPQPPNSYTTPEGSFTQQGGPSGAFVRNPLETGGTGTAPAAQSFTKGEQVRQNGVIYEFDGTNWNPVSQ